MSQKEKAEVNQENEQGEKEFCDRPYEEVEDGYIDDRGFYTTPNGSFWDDDHTYFNHLGFDRHGGCYDKYGVYQPGAEYDEKTGLYKDQKDLVADPEAVDTKAILDRAISKLKDQEKKDEKTIKKFEQPVEESEDSDNEDKSSVSYDDNDIKEAYEDVMNNEKQDKKEDKDDKEKEESA